MTGVDYTAKGVTIHEEVQFDNVGVAYYADKTTSNFLPFTSQIDGGAAIDYDKLTDAFTLQPAIDNPIHAFTSASICEVNGRKFEVVLSA